MSSATAIADIQVKNDLFKDVKYYVAGEIEPEACVDYPTHLAMSSQKMCK